MTRLATKNDIAALARSIAAAPRIALDTEFHAERRYVPALYLVQLNVPGDGVWIVDPLERGLLEGLKDALLSTSWVVHGGRWDMEVMKIALGGLPAQIVDTQIGAALIAPWWPVGYTELVRDYLGKELPKTATLSDWSRRPLSEEQLGYAAEDAELLLPLWNEIEARLVVEGRMEVCAAACAEARSRVLEPAPPDDAWRNIGARSVLKGQQLGVLQEIACWRRELAVRRNQPERSILSDGAVVELARRQPTTPQALTRNRRLPKSLQKNPDELLERLARAADRPEWAWPKSVRRRTAAWTTVAWLEVWAAALGQAHSFAGGLVFPRRLLEDVVLLDDPDQLRALLGEWRWGLAGPALLDALSGRCALRLRDGTVAIGTEEAGR
ncbi:MAG: HRDC domain-containing protein [Myxococcales bacterium]|nr:HRDC domain-containing protein [Myxococcales bacterium]